MSGTAVVRPRPGLADRACGRARLDAAVEAARRAATGRLDGLAWHALRVVSTREFAVVAELARAGLFGWTPTKTLWRKVNAAAKRKTARTFAALPGFVFLGVDGAARWDLALDCPGVLGVLGVAGRPARLSPAAVAWAMAQSATAPAVEQWMRSGREFAVGDRVSLECGLAGRVLAIKGRTAQVLAPFLGAERVVSAGLGELALAS